MTNLEKTKKDITNVHTKWAPQLPVFTVYMFLFHIHT